MDETTVKKIQAFVKKNPYPSYEFITDLLLSKAKTCKNMGDVEFKLHYLMMNSEYGYSNHNYMKEIYENIDDVGLLWRNGDEIDTIGGIQAMEYNALCLRWSPKLFSWWKRQNQIWAIWAVL